MIADKDRFCPVCREKCHGEECVFVFKEKEGNTLYCAFAIKEQFMTVATEAFAKLSGRKE